MLYGLYPWWGAPAPAPFPILPPVTQGCKHGECCNREKAKAYNVAIVEKDYSYVEFLGDGYVWQLQDKAPAGTYTAQLELGQAGYKRYVDGVACGAGATKARAYLTLQDEDGRMIFTADKVPADLGLSIPMLALAVDGTIVSESIGTEETVTVVELENDTIRRVYTVDNSVPRTLQEIITALEITGTAVIYDGSKKIRLKGMTRDDVELSLADEARDYTLSHTTIVGAP